MNKKEFLQILEESLKDFKLDERKEILYDYEEHFRIGEQNGKSEAELITELGDPNNIAMQYKTSNQQENNEVLKDKPEETRPMIIPIIAGCSLLFFNLIFILGPYVGIVGAIIGLFAGAFGIIIGGLGLILGVIMEPLIPQFVNIPLDISRFAMMFFGIGTLALGLLFLIGMCYVGKHFYKGTVKYINWNIKIIRGRR